MAHGLHDRARPCAADARGDRCPLRQLAQAAKRSETASKGRLTSGLLAGSVPGLTKGLMQSAWAVDRISRKRAGESDAAKKQLRCGQQGIARLRAGLICSAFASLILWPAG